MTHPRWKTKDEFPGSISIPFGIKTSHTWHEVGQILRIINDLDVKTFIELGSHVGGLASIISSRIFVDDNFEFMGYEINESIIDDFVREDIKIGDILTSEIKNDVVQRILDNEKKALIYCDGGNKVEEMKFYASILRSGDIIMCHDFYDGQRVEGLEGFGMDDGACGCKPEVDRYDLSELFRTGNFEVIPAYLLAGTRIMGFIKK